MSKRVQILSGVKIANPEAFLSGSLETRIVSFALSTEIVNGFEVFGFTVNRKSVVIRKRDIFSAAMSFAEIREIFVINGASARFRAFKGATKFL